MNVHKCRCLTAVRLMAVFLLVITLAGPAAAEMTIAVADFRSVNCPFYMGGAVSEQVRLRLSEEPDWVVVEKAQIAAVAAEQRLNMSGLVDDETAVKVGRFVGARYVIVGSVNGMGDMYTLSARLVDVETGVGLLGFETTTHEGENGLLDATNVLTEQIVTELGGSPD